MPNGPKVLATAARCRRAATGGHPRTATPASGWTSSSATCRPSPEQHRRPPPSSQQLLRASPRLGRDRHRRGCPFGSRRPDGHGRNRAAGPGRRVRSPLTVQARPGTHDPPSPPSSSIASRRRVGRGRRRRGQGRFAHAPGRGLGPRRSGATLQLSIRCSSRHLALSLSLAVSTGAVGTGAAAAGRHGPAGRRAGFCRRAGLRSKAEHRHENERDAASAHHGRSPQACAARPSGCG